MKADVSAFLRDDLSSLIDYSAYVQRVLRICSVDALQSMRDV